MHFFGQKYAGVYWAALIAVMCVVLWVVPFLYYERSLDHKITYIPGLVGSMKSKEYSGTIAIQGDSKHFFYWFIESQNDPKKDPILLWMQGGPGSSGLLGLLTEMGPYSTNDGTLRNVTENGVPSVFLNPWTWAKFANMLFFESPVGVGGSYCVPEQCGDITDESAAQDNFDFLIAFFKKYPKFQKNDFYITGESYGGIYVPMLGSLLLNSSLNHHFKGVAVGNGCTGIETKGGCGVNFDYWILMFLYGHGKISEKSFDAFREQNCVELFFSGNPDSYCIGMGQNLFWEAGYDKLNVYNVYDECYGKGDTVAKYLSSAFMMDNIRNKGMVSSTQLSSGITDYACGAEKGMHTWLSNQEVAEALHRTHISESLFTYASTRKEVYSLYKQMLDKGKKVLIFYGDTDTLVMHRGGEYWTTQEMGLEITKPWRPWTLNNDTFTAGHIIEFEKNFTYATVKGAGHMVPTYKPQAAYEMMYNWVMDIPFPAQDSLQVPAALAYRKSDIKRAGHSFTREFL